jgi:hypothetical protein
MFHAASDFNHSFSAKMHKEFSVASLGVARAAGRNREIEN